MTALDSHTRVPTVPGGHPALSRLVRVDAGTFAADYFGREPLLSTAETLPGGYSDLFGEDAVDELVTVRGLRAPFLRVAQNGRTLSDTDFTSGGGTGAGIKDQVSDDKLLRLFGNGATIVLQALHRTWPPLLAFAQQLAAELGHPVQVNSYTTPPQSQGFADHYDVHDVFVLQVAGEKRWRIRRPVLDAPLRNQPWEQRRSEVERAARQAPLMEETLRPGDCLYLPRGYLHSATALGGVSTHLTVGVHVWTGHHLAEHLATEAVRDLARDPAVRGSLPLGLDPTDPDQLREHAETVRAALARAVADLPVERLAAALNGPVSAAQRASAVGPLAQLRDAERLSDSDTVLLRRYAAARLERTGAGPVVVSRAGRYAVAPAHVDAVASLLAAGSARVANLGVDLARDLLLAGLATVALPGVASSAE